MRSNLGQVAQRIALKLKSIDSEKTLREVALATLASIRQRVHVEGKASDGSQIGRYHPDYLRIRAGKVGANEVVFGMKGSEIPKYHRGSDPRVILSLTRQMENDMCVVPHSRDCYTIGYSNSVDFEKSQKLERRYGKRIWSLSAEEQGQVNRIVEASEQEAMHERR